MHSTASVAHTIQRGQEANLPRLPSERSEGPKHAHESRAKKCPMPKDVASVVICEACGEQVAEIVVDEKKRALCSECHLMESGTRLRREKKTDTEE